MQLRIVTWNLHAGVGGDGRLDVGRLAREIRSLDADLVALQEVDAYRPRSGFASQWREYGEATGLAAFFGPNLTTVHAPGEAGPPGHPGRWVEQYGNAVLTRLPVRAAELHLLTYRGEGEGYHEQRGCLEIDAGPAVWLCTHWGLHQEERVGQSRDILALAGRPARPPSSAT